MEWGFSHFPAGIRAFLACFKCNQIVLMEARSITMILWKVLLSQWPCPPPTAIVRVCFLSLCCCPFLPVSILCLLAVLPPLPHGRLSQHASSRGHCGWIRAPSFPGAGCRGGSGCQVSLMLTYLDSSTLTRRGPVDQAQYAYYPRPSHASSSKHRQNTCRKALWKHCLDIIVQTHCVCMPNCVTLE